MAQYFDMLREEDPNILSNGKPEAALYESGSVTNRLINDLPLITPKDDAEASLLQRSGYVQNQDGTYQTPIRDLAQGMQQRELLKREAREIEYNKTRNSTMFKIGDALADTGRLFMSPLFWLSGEDTSKYDPSERLKTGYRKQFNESLAHTQGLYGRVQQAQKTRQDYRNQLQTSDEEIRQKRHDSNIPKSAVGKEIYDMVLGMGPDAVEMYRNKSPENARILLEMNAINKGTGSKIGDTFVMAQDRTYYKSMGDAHRSVATSYKNVFKSFSNLMISLDQDSALSDISAITQFNKILDEGSVVRESEVQLTVGARAAKSNFQAWFNKIDTGKTLTDTQRNELRELATAIGKSYYQSYKEMRGDAVDSFKTANINDPKFVKHFLGTEASDPLARSSNSSDSPNPSAIVIPTDPAVGEAINNYYNKEDEAQE
tara:strand:+ start:206 stop:1495 length:1290 start_codon:yes stop_codon:yes gene_type:complete